MARDISPEVRVKQAERLEAGTLVNLLYEIKAALNEALGDLRLYCKQDGDQPEDTKAFQIFLQTNPLPDQEAACPFILLQLVAGEDSWSDSKAKETCTANVRMVVAIYDLDPERGKLQLLSVLEKLRHDLKRKGILNGLFELKDPFEYLVYPDDTDTYHVAEISTTWTIPPVERYVPTLREDPQWVAAQKFLRRERE